MIARLATYRIRTYCRLVVRHEEYANRSDIKRSMREVMAVNRREKEGVMLKWKAKPGVLAVLLYVSTD